MNTKRVAVVAGTIALFAYALFLVLHLSYAMGGPDTSGYMNEARMLAAGHTTLPVDLVRIMKLDDSWLGRLMPLGFAPSAGGRMHPTYPRGLPMHLALAGIAGGWTRAPFLLMPLVAVASLALMFAVARKLDVPILLAAAGPVAVAFLPSFLWHAVQPASDVLAMFWTLAAIYCCLSKSTWGAYAGGVAFAIGVCVRPTNVLLAFAFVLAVRGRPKLLLRAAVAAVPFAIALMWWNAAQYGSPFQTGYGNVLGGLSWMGAAIAGPEYSRTLAEMLTPVVFPLGLIVIFDKFASPWTRWLLFAWFAPFFVFYCFYGFWDGWTCLRFLFPALPGLIIGALVLIRDFHKLLAARNVEVASVLTAAILLWMSIAPLSSSLHLNLISFLPQIEADYPRYVRWAEHHVPRHSIVVTGVLSGAFLYYENRSIARYDQLDDEHFQLLRAYAGNASLPWYAVVTDDEMDHAMLEKRLRGKWTMLDRVDAITIYRLDS